MFDVLTMDVLEKEDVEQTSTRFRGIEICLEKSFEVIT